MERTSESEDQVETNVTGMKDYCTKDMKAFVAFVSVLYVRGTGFIVRFYCLIGRPV